MSRSVEAPPSRAVAPGPAPAAPAGRGRLVGVDAARGLALIGMVSVHLLPAVDREGTGPSLQWTLFAGTASALFALLAGLGLALSSGGRTPHRGREMTADRVGLVVRALIVTAVGLLINEVMPTPAPAWGILVYYGAFFLLAVPLLHLRRRTLAACAAAAAILGPVLLHVLGPVLPQPQAANPTLGSVLADPGASLAQVLLTGTYPAVPYLTYLCAGLLLGRLDLHDVAVPVRLVALGGGTAVGAWLLYRQLILRGGGYDQLMQHTPWLSEAQIDEIIVWGPSPDLPTSTWWWLLTPGPHSTTPVSLLLDLGIAMAVLGTVLLIARRNPLWTTLAAMGASTLTLYAGHLLALATMVHTDHRALWFAAHVLVAAVLAVLWRAAFDRGPLEQLVRVAVRRARRQVCGRPRASTHVPRH